MSSMRKRQALYGYAPGSNPLTQTTTCLTLLLDVKYSTPEGSYIQ